MRKVFLALSALAGSLIPISRGIGATVSYTNSAAFSAATANPVTVAFNGILPPGSGFEGFNPLTVSGIDFSTPNPDTAVNVTAADFYSPNDYRADFIVDSVNPSPTNELVIAFPAPVHALALDYGGLGFNGAGGATITLSDGYVYSPATLATVGNTQFAGFASTDLISGLVLSTTNDSWVVEDLTTASIVPEPSTFAQLGVLLVLFGFFLRIFGALRLVRAKVHHESSSIRLCLAPPKR